MVFLVGSAIINQYRVADSDGTVTNVDFYLDNVLHYRDAAGFGQVIINDALVGVHTFSAVASDSCGVRATNTVTLTVTNPPYALLLANGSTWRYMDDGLTQAVSWVQLAFNDSGWSNGVAELGFGDVAQDCPEKTLVRRNGGLLNTNNVIYYFRKIIFVANPSAYSQVILSLLRDDGGVVYINENPVFTSAQGAYPPTAATADDGTVYFRTNLNSSVLVAGQNIIAVEIRQDNAGSSDISFDLMLWGVTSGPSLSITDDGINVHITWSGGGTLQFTDNMSNTPVWQDQTTGQVGPGNYVVPHNQAHRFYSLRQ